MGNTLSVVLPLALGAAVSPTLLTLQLMILAGAQSPLQRAWAMCAGAAAFLLAYMIVLATVARGLDLVTGAQNGFERGIKLLAAALLLLLGVRSVRRRHDPPKPPPRKLQEAGPGLFVGVGFTAMASNASSLVLVLPASHLTVTSGLPGDQKMLLLAMVFVITLLPVLLPVLATTLLGRRAAPGLARMNHVATTYSHQINAGIAFFFSIVLVVSALR